MSVFGYIFILRGMRTPIPKKVFIIINIIILVERLLLRNVACLSHSLYTHTETYSLTEKLYDLLNKLV